jgi:hypothetical protein
VRVAVEPDVGGVGRHLQIQAGERYGNKSLTPNWPRRLFPPFLRLMP